ncbi:MAG: phospholipase D family protein [Phycisphaerae bacterium]|nr:phospholipase D family protein [Phycisphaerae bacterium]
MFRKTRSTLKAGAVAWLFAAVCVGGLWSHHIVASEPPGKTPRIDVFFSPNGGCADRIIEEIGKARKRVLVQAYFFTSKPIAEAIIEAKERGVDCEVIADKSQEKMTYGRLPVLRRAGVPVWIDDQHPTANNKIILIDRSTIITGSMNFTKAGDEENAENLLVIRRHDDLFEKYLDNYTHHRSHSRRYKRD